MFEFLSIACLAAALNQTGCVPQSDAARGPHKIIADVYEIRVAPGMYQLSYAASGHEYDVSGLTQHWHERAALHCAGNYLGLPQTQIQYPEPGFDAMTSFLSVAAVRTFNVEVYGVAHCLERAR